jgi:DNA modification methylase
VSGRTTHPMTPLYGDRRRWGLVHADALWLLTQLPAQSVDAIVVDPPYGLNFLGHAWDGGALADGLGFQAFTRGWAEHALRVLKPGGYLASFGAARTVHRAVAGIEDAGLEVRDQLLWLFSGVPKSRRLPGGLGSTLKPMYEPIVLARRPLDRQTPTILGNVDRHGAGALNVAAARITRPASETGDGFWPPNLTLSHEPDCTDNRCGPACVTCLIDDLAAQEARPGAPRFSRLFYAAKASRAEREAGCQALEARVSPIFSPGSASSRPRANRHPTVKPLGLMRWLIRLVVPLGGVVLDPFAGSGSTGCAAVLEGRQFVGIERESEYVAIARARIAHWAAQAAQEAVP